MKLILSRKGFDSSAGGCPNPIFPDGSMLALPIPDSKSRIAYRDLTHQFNDGSSVSYADLVGQLTKGKIKPSSGAHLDPDMLTSAYVRDPQWRPVLGQTGAAQGHLAKQSVGAGDLFLYFGLFRDVELYKAGRKKPVWRFVPGSKPKHLLWGWMEVGERLTVDEEDFSDSCFSDRHWLKYHPHMHGQPDPNNTLYVSSDSLSFAPILKGAGVFRAVSEALVLTHSQSLKPSFWQLPEWFYPLLPQKYDQREPLSYHHKLDRWFAPSNGYCQLQSAARGQEFVLDLDQYPEAKPWLVELIQQNS